MIAHEFCQHYFQWISVTSIPSAVSILRVGLLRIRVQFMVGYDVCFHVWLWRLFSCVALTFVFICGHDVCFHVWLSRLFSCVALTFVFICGYDVCFHVWLWRLFSCVAMTFVLEAWLENWFWTCCNKMWLDFGACILCVCWSLCTRMVERELGWTIAWFCSIHFYR